MDDQDYIVTQDEINYGQARINFELCEVDINVIETLKMIVDALKKIKALPPLTHDLQSIDLNKLEASLSKAYNISKKVADIKPPGCEGPYPD
jgi:DNA topoisomerase VI subunit B